MYPSILVLASHKILTFYSKVSVVDQRNLNLEPTFRSKKAKRHVLKPVATFHHQKACANGYQYFQLPLRTTV